MEEVTRSAQKAIAYDKAGRWDAAIYFYVVSCPSFVLDEWTLWGRPLCISSGVQDVQDQASQPLMEGPLLIGNTAHGISLKMQVFIAGL